MTGGKTVIAPRRIKAWMLSQRHDKRRKWYDKLGKTGNKRKFNNH